MVRRRKRENRAEYYRGYRFEREVRSRLRNNGFIVVRGAASKPVDLVAFKDGHVVVVECKASPEGYSVERMKKEAVELYNAYKVPSVMAVRDGLGIAWAIAMPVKYNFVKLTRDLEKALGPRYIKVDASDMDQK